MPARARPIPLAGRLPLTRRGTPRRNLLLLLAYLLGAVTAVGVALQFL